METSHFGFEPRSRFRHPIKQEENCFKIMAGFQSTWLPGKRVTSLTIKMPYQRACFVFWDATVPRFKKSSVQRCSTDQCSCQAEAPIHQAELKQTQTSPLLLFISFNFLSYFVTQTWTLQHTQRKCHFYSEKRRRRNAFNVGCPGVILQKAVIGSIFITLWQRARGQGRNLH